MSQTTGDDESSQSGNLTIGNLGMLLVHEPNPLSVRLSAISNLQRIAMQEPFTTETVRAANALAVGIFSQSHLVKHECISALGQCRFWGVCQSLQGVLREQEESISCRIKAAQGLGLVKELGGETHIMLDLLQVRYNEENEPEVVRDVAEVAAARLSWGIGNEEKVDDIWEDATDLAPPFAYMPEDDPIQYFTSILLDPSESLFSRCRSMTNLRNLTKPQLTSNYSSPYTTLMAIQSLTSAFLQYQSSSSRLFLRVQLLTVLAQIKHKMILTFLQMQLRNHGESVLIREVAAESLMRCLLANEEETLSLQIAEDLLTFGEDHNEVVRECARFAIEFSREKMNDQS